MPAGVVLWLADPGLTGDLNIGLLAQYGVLGVVCVALFVFAKSTVQRERDRADRLEALNSKLNDSVADKVIPALTSATKAIEEATKLLDAVVRERESIRRHAAVGRED